MTSIGGSSPSYDADGNVTNDFLHSYAWNGYGRPTTIDGVGVTYDALDRVVEQNRSGAYTQFLYSPTGFKMINLNGQSAVDDFVPLAGGAVAVYSPGGIYLRHADWLGSSRFASWLSSRTMYYDGAYGPFGEPYAQAGTTDVNFTGMNQDTVANLYDFPAREYGTQGRWPSPDPAGPAAVDPTNPQSWNRYAYVLNNPLAFIDPLGLFKCYDQNGNEISAASEQECTRQGGIVSGGAITITVSDTPGPVPPIIFLPPPGLVDSGGVGGGNSGGGPANNGNIAKSVTNTCLTSYNNSRVAKGIQFFSFYHLVTDFRNALPGWTVLPAAKYAAAKTASWVSQQIGTTEFLSVTSNVSTVIPSTTSAVVDLAEAGAKAGATPAIVVGTGLDALANAGCATVGRQATGQMTPLPPGWASSL
jgi:RHS repeat-associated protein